MSATTIPPDRTSEIARKKQERSMVTQFKKYRDQQAKEDREMVMETLTSLKNILEHELLAASLAETHPGAEML